MGPQVRRVLTNLLMLRMQFGDIARPEFHKEIADEIRRLRAAPQINLYSSGSISQSRVMCAV